VAFTSRNVSNFSAEVEPYFGQPVTDVDGNEYSTVKIGDQIWMAENLNVIHYRDGSPIATRDAYDAWANTSSGAYGRSTLSDTYGAYYNWYAVNGDSNGDDVKDKELAPEGWHIPSDAEWNELETYIADRGYAENEAYALKSSSGWNGNNAFGFNAIPGGERDDTGFAFYVNAGDLGCFWTSTEYNDYDAHYQYFYTGLDVIRNFAQDKNMGLSIRCIKD